MRRYFFAAVFTTLAAAVFLVWNGSALDASAHERSSDLLPSSPSVATLKADYQFQNNRSSSVAGAPDLTSVAGGSSFVTSNVFGTTQTVLQFPQGSGLQLQPTTATIPNNVYTIAIIFKFDNTQGSSFRRVLDWWNGTNDAGLYIVQGHLKFYGYAGFDGSTALQDNTYYQVVMTRTAAGQVTGYVNGVPQFTFDDSSGSLAVINGSNTLKFYKDDGGEDSGGSVARIRLWDDVLTPAQVVALGPAFNPVNEFGSTQGGTTGVWGYGYTPGPTDNTFTPMPTADNLNACGGNFDRWTIGGSNPSIDRNTGGSFSGCGIRFPNDALYIHPGEATFGTDGRRAVVRWTAPASGTYQVTGVFEALQNITTSDVKIIKNATEPALFSGHVNPGITLQQQPFNMSVTVGQGDTIDFSVGCDGGCGNDSTGLALTIGPQITSCSPAPSGLSVWLPGENSTEDVQSLNTNGLLVGNATYTNDGRVGRAFSVDGNSSYIEVPDNPAQDPTTQFTGEGWWKIRDLNGTIPHFFAKGLRGTTADSYVMWFANSNIRIGYQPVSGGFTFFDTGFVPTLNTWNHYAFVINTTAGGNSPNSARLYVNGVEVFSGGIGSSAIYYNGINDGLPAYPLTLGSDTNSDIPDFFMNADIDEFSLYGRALSQSEIFGIYQQGSFGKCSPPRCAQASSGLISWWQGEGNALDSKSQNHGTLRGATTFTNGRVGRAFSFDGVNSSIDTRPTLNSDFSFPGDFTTEAWVKFTTPGTPTYSPMIFATGETNALVQMRISTTSSLEFVIRDSAGHTNDNIGTTALNDGQWHHVAGTRQGATTSIYVDGVLENLQTVGTVGAINSPCQFIYIGGFQSGQICDGTATESLFNGAIDEVAVYNRALSPTEIQSHVSAGQSGMCRPAAVNAPSGLAAWYPFGSDRDFTGNNPNPGTRNGNARFGVGRVDSALSLDGTANTYFSVADNAAQKPASGITIESWVNVTSANTQTIISKPFNNSNLNSYVMFIEGGQYQCGYGTTGGFVRNASGVAPRASEWTHLACTIDPANPSGGLKFYINGALVRAVDATLPLTYEANAAPLLIGAEFEGSPTPSFLTLGKIDEVSLYNRALTGNEVASIYNAGAAGKIKSVATPMNPGQSLTSFVGRSLLPLRGLGTKLMSAVPSRFTPGAPAAPTTVTLSDATVTFAQVTTPGVTTEAGVDLGLLPPLPAGATFTGLAYDISTTAAYQNGNSNDVQVCFDLSSLAGSFTAANLAIYHLESNSWVNRTAPGGTLASMCTNALTSLSPFAIATPASTTAASVSVSGRILTADGAGLRNATVMMTDANGKMRKAVSGSFGYYIFNDVPAGGSYTFVVSARKFTFSPRIVTLRDQMTEFDFRALY